MDGLGMLLAFLPGMDSPPARPLPEPSRGLLLIVDDELPLLQAISRYLGRQGYDVQTAATAHDALGRLAERPAEVMLCDVGLPDMEAEDLVAAARDAVPGMLVLMFSGWHDSRVADRLLAAGAFAYVTKPLPLLDLRGIVDKAVLHRRSVAGPFTGS